MGKAEDYPWSSAKAHVSGVKDTVLSDNGPLQEKGIETYREFLRHEDAEFGASIRTATSTGRVLGTEEFANMIKEILHREILPRKAGRSRKE